MPTPSCLELNLRLLSPGQLLAIRLGMVGVLSGLALLIGSFEPCFEATCQRDGAAAGSCVLRESTFLSSHGASADSALRRDGETTTNGR